MQDMGYKTKITGSNRPNIAVDCYIVVAKYQLTSP